MARTKRFSDTRARLEGPFTAIARAMSDKWDVVIKASGTELCTDGDIIKFPWNADDIDALPFAVLNGYLDHEVGHIVEERKHREAGRETPLQVMRGLKNPTLKMLLNVFEDIRMEIAFGADYIGVGENLRAANIHSVELFERRHGSGAKGNFWHTLGCGIILQARDCSIDWMPAEYIPYMELVQPEIAASLTATSVQDTAKLAQRVYDKVRHAAEELLKKLEELKAKAKEEAKKRREEAKKRAEERRERGEDGEDDGAEGEDGEPQPGGSEDDEDGEGGASGDEGEDDGEGGSPADGDASDGDEGDADGEGGTGDIEAKPSDEAAEAAKKAATEHASSEHIMDAVGDEIKRESERKRDRDGTYIPNPDVQAMDTWFKPEMGSRDVYNEIRAGVSSQTSALRTKLARIIRILTEARTAHDQERGRLDTTALHQLRLNNKRVFSVVTPAIELDTAVSIVIDMSGSMGSADSAGSASHYARATCVALSEAFAALNVPFEVVGFDNNSMIRPPRRPGFVNRTPLRFRVFKGFDEQFKKVAPRFVGITGQLDNSDGEAVLECAKRLASRPEPRKIMFVLSDGAPCCSGMGSEGDKHLQDSVKRITKAGIEVIGIGLRHAAVSHYYGEKQGAQYVVINDLTTMAADIFRVASKSLTRGLNGRRAA
jgi:cobalamin biosynthesis protein CobT